MILMGPVTSYKLWAIICLVLIKDGYNCDLKEEELLNTANEETEENRGFAGEAVDQDSLTSFTQAEAKCEKLIGGSEAAKWETSDSPHLWKKTAPLSKRRVEIHPKFEGKVTLSQIEKECEESMRKQLKENQHKKKLQFSFIGKRNDTGESFSLDQTELHRDKRNLTCFENNGRTNRSSNKGVIKNESDLKGSGKRWMLAGEMQSDDGNSQNNAVNKLAVDKIAQSSNKVTDNNAVSNLDSPKNNQEIVINDKSLKSTDPQNTSNSVLSELGQLERENKLVLKELTDYEDRDLKLLKLLYEGLNSKDVGVNEVEPLVKTLKEIADKKIAINMITHNNITTKPVAMKVEEKMKSGGQLKCANELFTKIKEYKDKHQDKKMIDNHFGSSPLNPNLINSRKETIYPVISKNLFLTQPRRVYPEIFSLPKKNSPVLANSLPTEQSDSSSIALLPTNLNNNSSESKSMNDYAIFVRLIDKILGTISENNTEASELLHDLNRKLLGTSKELGSYKMLEDLVREFGSSVAKIKGSHKFTDSGGERIEDIMRNARDLKNFRDRYVESRVRNEQSSHQSKIEQSTKSSTSKLPNKNWSKSDELRRLQKVATELKSKIDDLLQNLEGTMSDAEEDEEEEEDDDDDDDEGDEESMIRESNSTISANSISTGARRNKVSDDPFESFKKFKVAETKMDKRKFKEYEPKGRLNKVVGKKPITMSNRYKSFDDKKNKYFKLRRDKRNEDCDQQYYDKYDIYNFKSSRRKSGDELGSRDNPTNGIQDNSYGSIYVDPNRINPAKNEFPLTYKNADNNFNVFRVANEFKKVHRDMIDRRMESSPQVSGFQKYLGNNHQLRGKEFDIRRQFEGATKNKSGKIKKSDVCSEDINNQNMENDSIVNEIEGHKRNNTDIPHWLDYNDSEIRGKNNPNIIHFEKKKYFKDLNMFNNNIDRISTGYRKRRSLMNLFDYFKTNKDKDDEKMLNKVVAKEIQINGTAVNSKMNASKDSRTTLLEVSDSSKNQVKEQLEQVTPSPSADPQVNSGFDCILS